MGFQPDQRVGELRIERELGRGAYGVVYLARDTLLGRRVALKVLPGETGEVPAPVREQILTEARLIGNLNSPHVATLYRLHVNGSWMQEMEYIDGGSLEDRLDADRPLPLADAAHVYRGVCRALKAAHAARVIHGDIKPANVLFTSDNLVKLADFGLARMLEDTGAAVPLHGNVFGTPQYMAPEVISGQESGMASDLWAANVLLYRMLTGRLPFEAGDFGELFRKILYEEPAPLGPEVPAPLSALLFRCLSKQSDARPPSVADVLDELDGLAALDTRLAPTATGRERPTNFVPPTTSFIGREKELAELTERLRGGEDRLVTLLGPGGIGKTRLSQELCGRMLDHLEGGCWFADLSETHDADGIAHAVAGALGVSHTGAEDPVGLVAGVLQYRKPMLLVLDNFEHIMEHAPGTVGVWLKGSPNVRFLVTSRELLALTGERHYELHPLPTPPPGAEAAEDYAGVRLFVERAREASTEFELDPSNAADVARICRELDGMPLAIELAAARARVMQPRQIAARLGKKFQLLKSTQRDLTPRQRTLTGAIEWSFDLLEDWEKDAYLQACYFHEGFDLDAAEAVVDLDAFEAAPLTMDVFQSLRDKSLLTASAEAGYETRLGMYRAIREYGARKWRETASENRKEALARRHADYYLALADAWNARIPGPRAQEALDRIAAEIGNLTAVQSWALESDDRTTATRAALAVAETMKVRRPPRQLIALLDRVLAAQREAASTDAARLLTHLTGACRLAGDWDRAIGSAREAVAAARATGDAGTLAAALLEQAEMCRNRGELQEALAAFTEAGEIARTTGDRRVLAASTGGQGMVVWFQGDMDAADRCFVEAEAIAREIGDHETQALHIGNRGVVFESHGELKKAIACQRKAEDISRRLGNRLRVAVHLGNRANVYAQGGDLDAAHRCYAEAEAIARELGAKQRIAITVGNHGAVYAMRDELDAALACYAEAEAIARELGDQRRIAKTLGQRANVLVRREDAEGALDCYRQAERIGQEIGDRDLVARNLCQRGCLHDDLGQGDEAWQALRDGIALYDDMHANQSVWYFTFKATLAHLAATRGDESAPALVTEGIELAAHLGIREDHPDAAMREALATLRALRGHATE